ncbi:class I adenylate-forming enzyme family protein [Desulfurivibrio alkaliphilus]|uniref:AMP-dependent synthetase and ligase n=1 Tax=Desulfurivibrio alkaliphilus (strain DSM 19089 / UNIQEM U267 / AHT2) TaxID=589865 RepID=D6Z4G8_DESAT|nr:AMP-binding protein [Desulfurivibrio alkaliphilus]ADH86443.1 AMP-dependent synthetase and ligase [Desulfurivibrio alkaliphilus AHT 2]
MLLHHFFDDTVRRLPDKVALVCEGTSYTYADLDTRVGQLAGRLRAGGVTRGDRVALFLDNGVELVAGVLATLRIGCVFMPINPMTKQEKLAYLLNDARAAALVTQVNLRRTWEPALAANGTVRACLVAGTSATTPLPECCRPYPSADEPCAGPEKEPATFDHDLAAIIYTSGSTGDPKGVMLTHINMVAATRSVSTYLGLREEDTIICVLPLAFDYGLYQLLMAVKVGATLVLEASFAFPVKILELAAREKVTVLPGVPTIFSHLMHLDNLERFDLSKLRLITNTAAALSEEHIRRLRGLFPQAALFSMYGLTECKRVTYLPPEQLNIRPTSVGRGMPNVEVWLVDESGQLLPNGSIGELVIRGPNVMRGYWEKPAETAKRLKPGPLPGEMVLYSGDIFRTDEEGWLYFVARKDDIIKSRGEKVSPREVENAIYCLEGVQDVAVIGVGDEVLGQAIKAFVVPREGHTLTEREIIRHCLAHLENFMAPKYVEIVADLPKTETGKIKKTGLQ